MDKRIKHRANKDELQEMITWSKKLKDGRDEEILIDMINSLELGHITMDGIRRKARRTAREEFGYDFYPDCEMWCCGYPKSCGACE